MPLRKLRFRTQNYYDANHDQQELENHNRPDPRPEGEPDALPPHNLLQFVSVIAEDGFLRLTQLIQGLFVFIKMLFVVFLERFLFRLDRLDVFTIEYGLESELL